jgi:hypothetical protein
MVGVPFAASRVFDELASLALDTAPGTRRRKCGRKSLDRADDAFFLLLRGVPEWGHAQANWDQERSLK